ncbi:hypothetical protein CWRG_01234 [Chthonomonas calidirosea]|uniref:hypothetical protein n=1 Tax=Chthonomonas calidirosea TaxID=454171 RepID=UPI0006DD3AEA|nr:hypothetical protein [Chthonomonas calidirosea]CEK15676.1 hypothetical protein CWRG_01234 [Chthonomonas calidirosea]
MKKLGTLCSLMLALALCMGGLLLGSPARAQEDNYSLPELSRDWTVRIGLWVAQSKTARSVEGDVGISGLVQRRVYAGGTYDLLVGIGYNGFDKVYSVPLTLEIQAFRGNLRYGIGAGYSFGKRLNGRGSNGAVLNLLVGYQLTHGTNPVSVDLRYFFVSGSNDELDGYSLTLGYQF